MNDYVSVGTAGQLQDALNNKSISTINVTNNITLDSGDIHTINRDLTIDLAGNTLTQNDDIEVTEGNTLTITSEEDGAELKGTGDITGNGEFNDKVYFAGGDGSSSAPYQISNWHHLNNVRDNLDANFTLVNDLDSNTEGYSDHVSSSSNGSKGWDPIGDENSPITGIFNGDGYVINDLIIDRTGENDIGLFGRNEGTIKNLGVENVDITGIEDNGDGGDQVAGLVGSNEGVIDNSHTTGEVTGHFGVGGLVGGNYDGSKISESYSTAVVNAEGSLAGGLAGSNHTKITNSYATGTVDAPEDAEETGGLVGDNSGSIDASYATGNVTGGEGVGGLVGKNDGSILKSYAEGNVTGGNNELFIGGLVGQNRGNSVGIIKNSYAIGDVKGSRYVGGLVGDSYGDISNSYSTGSVTGDAHVGGLVGDATETDVTDSYWDTETSDIKTSDAGEGRTTIQMQEGTADDTIDGNAIYTNWNSNIWNFGTNSEYPKLDWQK